MGHDVVEAVGTDAAVPEAAQVRRDDFEAGLGEWSDDAPEDALRLRPAVHAHERHPAGPLVDEGLREAAG